MTGEAASDVWRIILSIPLGKIVGWIAVLVSIISFVCFCVIKLYKVFLRYTALKNENVEQKDTLARHEILFEEIGKSLEDIRTSIRNQQNVSYKQLKYTIVSMCEEAVCDGYISAGRLSFLEEMYKDYVDIFNGNGYGKVMMERVRALPVTGSVGSTD